MSLIEYDSLSGVRFLAEGIPIWDSGDGTQKKTRPRELAVNVLGTHFNVNAYGDEAPVKTTLLEGSVKVSKGAISKAQPQQIPAPHDPI